MLGEVLPKCTLCNLCTLLLCTFPTCSPQHVAPTATTKTHVCPIVTYIRNAIPCPCNSSVPFTTRCYTHSPLDVCPVCISSIAVVAQKRVMSWTSFTVASSVLRHTNYYRGIIQGSAWVGGFPRQTQSKTFVPQCVHANVKTWRRNELSLQVV